MTANASAMSRNPQGSGVGAALCAGFAALWAVTGLSSWATGFNGIGYLIIAAVTLPLLYACARLIRTARRTPPTTDRLAARRRNRNFWLVFAVEIIAINIAADLLPSHHLSQYLMPIVALVVGLHFFPLARIFGMPHYHLTGALMTLASIAGIVLLAFGGDSRACNAGVDLICAVTLWGTACLTLRMWHKYGLRARTFD